MINSKNERKKNGIFRFIVIIIKNPARRKAKKRQNKNRYSNTKSCASESQKNAKIKTVIVIQNPARRKAKKTPK